ncbi:MAG: DUF2804 domain-containing protein [Treponema sp.]|nr:DUF2804 family protein [Treponema sp.]MCR5620327.1 DUF2804 domain-containing protein [Treponema sp.]
MYNRKIQPCPEGFVKAGKPVFGTFSGVPERIDIRGVRNPYSAFHFLPPVVTNFRIKSRLSYFFSIGNYAGCIEFFDAKVFSFEELSFWEKTTKRRFVYRAVMGPRRRFIPHSLHSGFVMNNASRRYSRISWDKKHRKFSFIFHMAGYKGTPASNAAFISRMESEDVASLTTCNPSPTSRRCSLHFMQTMPIHGALSTREKDGTARFMEDSEGICFFDMARHYMKFHSQGEYVTGLGQVDGRAISVRLEISSQDAVDPYAHNSNVLFIGGRATPLPPVRITHNHGLMKDWNIQDTEGMVDLRFTPASDNHNLISTLMLKTEYHTIFGNLEGTLVTDDGEKISFKSLEGIAKKYRIRL